jgi:hypothetical protein
MPVLPAIGHLSCILSCTFYPEYLNSPSHISSWYHVTTLATTFDVSQAMTNWYLLNKLKVCWTVTVLPREALNKTETHERNSHKCGRHSLWLSVETSSNWWSGFLHASPNLFSYISGTAIYNFNQQVRFLFSVISLITPTLGGKPVMSTDVHIKAGTENCLSGTNVCLFGFQFEGDS